MSIHIPDSIRDLLENPHAAVISTVTPDGKPQSNPVWFLYDGTHIVINSAVGRLKDDNIIANPNVCVTIVDPTNMYRYIELRGVVEERTTDGAVEVINQLAKMYRGVDEYYGGVTPKDLAERETRVTYKIKPERVIAHG